MYLSNCPNVFVQIANWETLEDFEGLVPLLRKCSDVSYGIGIERQEAKPVNHRFMSFPTLRVSFVKNIAPIHLPVFLWPSLKGGNVEAGERHWRTPNKKRLNYRLKNIKWDLTKHPKFQAVLYWMHFLLLLCFKHFIVSPKTLLYEQRHWCLSTGMRCDCLVALLLSASLSGIDTHIALKKGKKIFTQKTLIRYLSLNLFSCPK